jgi:hypothetical protein
MTHEEESRLSEFRSDLLSLLGKMYTELSAVRKTVRPARLFGEGAVEELMELIADLIADDPPRQLECLHVNAIQWRTDTQHQNRSELRRTTR